MSQLVHIEKHVGSSGGSLPNEDVVKKFSIDSDGNLLYDGKVISTNIVYNTPYDATTNKAATMNDVKAAVSGLNYEIVTTLPTTGEAGTIYLVPNSGTGNNVYDEYLFINSAFELIGNTTVDVSNKADKATTLAGYGIGDAKIVSGTITLGTESITPLTSDSSLDASKLTGSLPAGTYTDTDTTYTLSQDSTDGHKITLTPSSGSATTITIPDENTTYSSKEAVSGGTDVSLVTTGEKYTWNQCPTFSWDSDTLTLTIMPATSPEVSPGDIIAEK